MQNCPCCSDKLLRHVKGGSTYWLCRSCWQEMPVFELEDRQAESPLLHPLHHKSLSNSIALNQA